MTALQFRDPCLRRRRFICESQGHGGPPCWTDSFDGLVLNVPVQGQLPGVEDVAVPDLKTGEEIVLGRHTLLLLLVHRESRHVW